MIIAGWGIAVAFGIIPLVFILAAILAPNRKDKGGTDGKIDS